MARYLALDVAERGCKNSGANLGRLTVGQLRGVLTGSHISLSFDARRNRMDNGKRNARLRRHGRVSLVAAAGIACLLVVPSLASAQGGAVGGTVTDTTGGILPGVTVEARSPALIEGVRTAVSDGSGQYRIIALEPGPYEVTFTLPGFSTLVRDGIEITTGFTANIDVELAVGSLEETITVTEASPIIDVQSIEQRETITREIYEVIPTTRGYDSLALLIPAMNIQGGPTTSLSVDTGGMSGEGNNRLSIHGSRDSDSEVHIDGMDSNLVALEGAPQGTPFDTAIQEYVYDYSGNSAEVETGGVRLNLIPKEGSNTFSGGLFTNFSHPSWLANNVDQDLIDLGIVGGKDGGVGLDQSWNTSPSIGGPIVEDSLWFFTSYSFRRGSILPANLFDSEDTSALLYVPGPDQTVDRSDIYEGTLRLTWQATSRDKVQVYWSNNHTRQIPALSGSQLDPIYIAPEAGDELVTSVNTYQISWVRPQTNRILFEAAVGMQPAHNILFPLNDTFGPGNGAFLDARTDLYGSFEASTLTMSRNMGFFFGGTDVHFSTTNTSGRGAMSYVTGSHNLKIGFTANAKLQNESYRSGSGWTNQITFMGVLGNPTATWPVQARFQARPNETNELTDIGVYVQNQWTLDRLTINAGVRIDYFNGSYPDQVTESMRWAPIPRMFPGATVASWKDFQPRLGIVYDVRGDGRTAIKGSASRYGDRNAISLAGSLNPVANNTLMSRTWLDGAVCLPGAACIFGDGLVQGNPLLPYPNGEILSFNQTPGFASPEITKFFDEDYAFGWGKKAANWEYSASIQHEVTDGVSIDIGYFRRRYVNFNVNDDRSNDPGDWDEWQFVVPMDSRLPGGGGNTLTLVDLNPAAIAVPNRLTLNADAFGGRSESWQGVDASMSVRLGGVLLNGGYATGKRTRDDCAVNDALPERINQGAGGLTGGGDSVIAKEFCANETPWVSQGSVYGSYTFPSDIVLSGAFFSRRGTERLTVITIPASVAAAALGRPPTEDAISVNVVSPGSFYGDRLNQFDLRVAKLLDFGGANLRASFDIYNVFNANAVGRERYTLSSFLQPLGVQPGRLAKVTAQFNF